MYYAQSNTYRYKGKSYKAYVDKFQLSETNVLRCHMLVKGQWWYAATKYAPQGKEGDIEKCFAAIARKKIDG